MSIEIYSYNNYNLSEVDYRKRTNIMLKKRIISMTVIISIILCLFPIRINAKQKPKLNKKSITLKVGKCYKLKLKYAKKKVRWKSKNKKIATITSAGCVWGKKQGKTKVFACVGKKKFYCTVSVKDTRKKRQTLSLKDKISVTNYVVPPTACHNSYLGYTISIASVNKFNYSIRESTDGTYCIDIQMDIEKTYDCIENWTSEVVIYCYLCPSFMGLKTSVYSVTCRESGLTKGDTRTISATIKNVACGDYNILVSGIDTKS